MILIVKFNNGPRSLPRIPSNFIIIYNRVFDSFILTGKLFVKYLRGLASCILVNNNLYGNLISSWGLPIIFDGTLKTAEEGFLTTGCGLITRHF